MTPRPTPLLHREDPAKDPLVGHVKVTREDWLNAARDVLVSEGVGQVKIMPLGERLGVSRSSFYWYFESRKHLLTDLLDEWEQRNTRSIKDQCERPTANITQAVCDFFRCFIDPRLFDVGLDFAVRDWARRDKAVRKLIDDADTQRIAAVVDLFGRFGYSDSDADARARIIYFMQLGYHALGVAETMETRMSRLESYVQGFTGQSPDAKAIADFKQFVFDTNRAA